LLIRATSVLGAVAISTLSSVGGPASLCWANSPIPVDLTHQPLPRLQPGIVIGRQHEFGYSSVVTMVLPQLASGDVDSLPEMARRLANTFNLTILANVVERPSPTRPEFLLDKVGIGFAMDIQGTMIIVTSETANQLGANLGMIDRGVLSGNENTLADVVQVARTDRLVVFDAKANVVVQDRHEPRVLRHFVWASPASGRLGILVWQLKEHDAMQYAIDSAEMQWLPEGFREDRRIHVSPGNFLTSRIPTPDRFALETMPQGTPVPFSDRMRQVAGQRSLTHADLESFLAGASESLAALPVPSVAKKP
jgi:hypothetical protein